MDNGRDRAKKLSSPVFRELLFRRLVIFNTMISLAGVLVLIVAAIVFRPYIPPAIAEFVKKQIIASTFVERVQETLSIQPPIKPSLPEFQVNLPPATLRGTELLSRQLVEKGFMSELDEIWFPGRLAFANENYDVKLRLRGLLSNHWSGPKKSWSAKFKKDHLFRGYRRINLVLPDDKGYEAEHLAFVMARRLGLLAPDSGFSTVRMNGVDMGLYFWFEHFTKEMLERHNHPNGTIIAHSRTTMDKIGYERIGVEPAERNAETFEVRFSEGIAKQAVLGRWLAFMEIIDLDNDAIMNNISYYLDLEKFSRWNALLWMFGTPHAMFPGNIKWFYDPTSGLFEPIMFDVGHPHPLDTTSDAGERISGPTGSIDFDHLANRIVRRLLRIPEIQIHRNKVLWEMLNDSKFDLAKETEGVFSEIGPAMSQGISALGIREAKEVRDRHLDAYRANARTLKRFLEYGVARVSAKGSNVDNRLSIGVSIHTDGMSPLRIASFQLGKVEMEEARGAKAVLSRRGGRVAIDIGYRLLDSEDGTTMVFDDNTLWTEQTASLRPRDTEWNLLVEFPGIATNRTTLDGLPNLKLTLENAITGQTLVAPQVNELEIALIGVGAPDVPSLRRPLSEFAALSGLPFSIDGRFLTLENGDYVIEEDLIFPANITLVLKAGVNLLLKPGVNIFIRGVVRILGTAAKPVSISPFSEEGPWGVFAVVGAHGTSVVRHLVLSGGSAGWVSGMFFTGQANFFHADVDVEDSTFTRAHGDDGLNVKRGRVDILRSRFVDNISDGFDGDFIEGKISDSVITNNGGDGLDFAGSQVIVKDTYFSGMGDKAISIGEKSSVVVYNSVVRDSTIGIASKDLSKTRIFSTALIGNSIALDARRKKPVFGGGRINVANSILWNNKKDFNIDALSSIQLQRVGLERREIVRGLAIDDVVVGEINRDYKDGGQAQIFFIGGASSPFGHGTKRPVDEVTGLSFPDFSRSPIGLVRPLQGPQ
jgi:hypothetical protein